MKINNMSWAEQVNKQNARSFTEKNLNSEIKALPVARKAKRVFLKPVLSAQELLANYNALESDKVELSDWIKSLTTKNKEILLKAKRIVSDQQQIIKPVGVKKPEAELLIRREVKKTERLKSIQKRNEELKLERKKVKETRRTEKLDLIRLQKQHKIAERMARNAKGKKERQLANSKIIENANMCPTMPGANGSTILLMDSKTKITVPAGKDPEAVYWKYFNRDKNL